MNEKIKSKIPGNIRALHLQDHSILQYLSKKATIQEGSNTVFSNVTSIVELASQFALTPVVLLEHLLRLAEYGVEFSVIDRNHCQLRHAIDLLDADWIKRELPVSQQTVLSQIEIHSAVDSTNQLLLSKAKKVQQAHACLAEYQTSGRGRHGRRWVTPYAAGLCLSLCWFLPAAIDRRQLISLLPGVALMRVLKKAGLDQQSGLKWPNDLISHGCKLAGVLVETLPERDGKLAVIIGIGINVYNTRLKNRADLMAEVQQPWLALSEIKNADQTLSRNQLAASLINELVQMLITVEAEGFTFVLEEWRSYDITRNKPVKLIWAENKVQLEEMGVARGISAEGALKLEIDGEIQEFVSGELSLRLMGEK